MTIPQRFVRENRGVVAEAVDDKAGVWRIRIISAGEGSSGYYPAEVLERDGRRAFKVGTKSYLNHPAMSESWERPERDVEKICGVQVTEVEYDPTDQSLYANVKFGREHRTFIEDFHESLGMSIYAWAESEVGTVGEYTGDIITHLLESPENSVDVVTVAGANGAIISQVSEGYRSFVSKGTSKKEATAPIHRTEGTKLDKELKEAIDAIAPAIIAALTEALKPTPAEPVTESKLADEFELVAESELPKEARTVVYEAIKAGTPAAGAIASQNKLVESIEAALKAKMEAAEQSVGRALESGTDFEFRGFGGDK